MNHTPSNTLSENLLDELRAMNPWWSGDSTVEVPSYKRSIYQRLYDSVTAGHYKIVALRGPRQVGKTVLQKQMIKDLLEKKRLVSPRQIFRVQFDDISALDISDPIVTIIRWFEKNVVQDTFNNLAAKGLPVYIFLDEFQNVKDWSAQLKHISDHGECKFFITGSSALRIIEGKESLAGRVQWNEVSSLGLAEIAAFRNLGSLYPYREKLDLCELKKKEFWIDLKQGNWQSGGDKPILLDSVYESFCDLGGYPFCHKSQEITRQEAEDYLYETVVARTIDLDLRFKLSEHKSILNKTLLTNVFKTFCKYTGMDVSLDHLKREVNAAYSESLKNAQVRTLLEFFEQAMLVKVIRPFEHRLKSSKECVKICLCDHAIRSAWMKEEIPLYGSNVNADLAGHIIEGIIGTFFASVKQLGVSYFPPVGKGKEGEVDFVLEIGVQHLPVEVKYKNNPDLGTGMKTFLNKAAYNAPFGLVITKDEVAIDYFRDERIVPISAKKLLLLK